MSFISKYAVKIMLVLLTMVILFHLCIIIKVIPYEITWGGQLKSDTEMYIFETVSILINLFLSLVLLMKGDFIKHKFSNKAVSIILWVFFLLFVLNTIGNLFAKTSFEKSFTILTLIFAILIWHILRKSNRATGLERKLKTALR